MGNYNNVRIVGPNPASTNDRWGGVPIDEFGSRAIKFLKEHCERTPGEFGNYLDPTELKSASMCVQKGLESKLFKKFAPKWAGKFIEMDFKLVFNNFEFSVLFYVKGGRSSIEEFKIYPDKHIEYWGARNCVDYGNEALKMLKAVLGIDGETYSPHQRNKSFKKHFSDLKKRVQTKDGRKRVQNFYDNVKADILQNKRDFEGMKRP